jgi:hypothetical protein
MISNIFKRFFHKHQYSQKRRVDCCTDEQVCLVCGKTILHYSHDYKEVKANLVSAPLSCGDGDVEYIRQILKCTKCNSYTSKKYYV